MNEFKHILDVIALIGMLWLIDLLYENRWKWCNNNCEICKNWQCEKRRTGRNDKKTENEKKLIDIQSKC